MNKITLTNNKAARLDQNAAAIYLTSLNSEAGRRTMRQALNVCAGLLSENADALTFAWHELRFQHVTAIRARLTEVYKPATVNKMLAALRGVLRSSWQAGQITAEDFHKAASVKSVKGETLPAGRELTQGEITALMADCEHDTTNAGARDADPKSGALSIELLRRGRPKLYTICPRRIASCVIESCIFPERKGILQMADIKSFGERVAETSKR
jgi:hypothetical protein